MVGKVTVRGQGPVRRKQTTTTFKKGGRVKLYRGGKPSARTRHIENEKEEIRRVDRNIRRNEGYKTGGRVKKAAGGAMKAGARSIRKVGEYIKDVSDATKKMSPHQDPRSERSAKMRHSFDNLKTSKKKSDHHPDAKPKRMGPPGKGKPGMGKGKAAAGMKKAMPKRKK